MTIADHDEQTLINSAQVGDTDAFATLVMMHGSLVYNLALRTLGDAQEAEDVAQETFVRAWQGLPRFRAQSRLSTWLYRITTNLCYNRLPLLRQELVAMDPEAPAPGTTSPREGGHEPACAARAERPCKQPSAACCSRCLHRLRAVPCSTAMPGAAILAGVMVWRRRRH